MRRHTEASSPFIPDHRAACAAGSNWTDIFDLLIAILFLLLLPSPRSISNAVQPLQVYFQCHTVPSHCLSVHLCTRETRAGATISTRQIHTYSPTVGSIVDWRTDWSISQPTLTQWKARLESWVKTWSCDSWSSLRTSGCEQLPVIWPKCAVGSAHGILILSEKAMEATSHRAGTQVIPIAEPNPRFVLLPPHSDRPTLLEECEAVRGSVQQCASAPLFPDPVQRGQCWSLLGPGCALCHH